LNRIIIAGSCKHGYEPLGSIKRGEFVTNWATVSFSRKILVYGTDLLVMSDRIIIIIIVIVIVINSPLQMDLNNGQGT
jgi:hypothetical protein